MVLMPPKERRQLWSYVGFIKRRLRRLDELKILYEQKLLDTTLHLEKTSSRQYSPKRNNKGKFCK